MPTMHTRINQHSTIESAAEFEETLDGILAEPDNAPTALDDRRLHSVAYALTDRVSSHPAQLPALLTYMARLPVRHQAAVLNYLTHLHGNGTATVSDVALERVAEDARFEALRDWLVPFDQLAAEVVSDPAGTLLVDAHEIPAMTGVLYRYGVQNPDALTNILRYADRLSSTARATLERAFMRAGPHWTMEDARTHGAKAARALHQPRGRTR